MSAVPLLCPCCDTPMAPKSSFGQIRLVHQRGLPRRTYQRGHHGQHESFWQLAGQCAHGKLLGHPEARMCRHRLRFTHPCAHGYLQLHHGLLQPTAPPFRTGLSQPGGFRTPARETTSHSTKLGDCQLLIESSTIRRLACTRLMQQQEASLRRLARLTSCTLTCVRVGCAFLRHAPPCGLLHRSVNNQRLSASSSHTCHLHFGRLSKVHL